MSLPRKSTMRVCFGELVFLENFGNSDDRYLGAPALYSSTANNAP